MQSNAIFALRSSELMVDAAARMVVPGPGRKARVHRVLQTDAVMADDGTASDGGCCLAMDDVLHGLVDSRKGTRHPRKNAWSKRLRKVLVNGEAAISSGLST